MTLTLDAPAPMVHEFLDLLLEKGEDETKRILMRTLDTLAEPFSYYAKTRILVNNETKKRVLLSERESQILLLLNAADNSVVSRDDLSARNGAMTTRDPLDQLVSKLRKKLKKIGAHPNLLTSSRGVGYAFLSKCEVVQHSYTKT